jgi:predicted TIM-barrel fold metal-dependent hydrolase
MVILRSVSSPAALTEPAPAPSDPLATALVDCDVHPLIRDVSALKSRMSRRAARRVFGEQVQTSARDPNRIPHPTSGLRLDAVTPSGGPPGSDPQFAREQWMDRYDVSAAILIPIQSGAVIPWGDEPAAEEFLRAFNDHFLEEWHGLDSRYRLAISISPYDPAAAIREIERLAAVPGVAGIFIPDAAVAMGRRQWFPVYDAARSFGLPIVHHVSGGEGNMYNSPVLAGGLPNSYPERHSLLAQPGVAIVASMVFAGVFETFPDLKLVMVEYGFSWVPPAMWRMDQAWERGDQALADLPRAPSEYIAANVRFTTQPIDEPPEQRMLWDVLEMLPAEQMLMFSSDYPHWDTDDPRVTLNSRIPPKLRRRVAVDTALECFGERLGLSA